MANSEQDVGFLPHNEAEESLLEAIMKLPELDREAVRLRYVSKWPTKEIAQQLHKSDGAVRVMLSRARTKLRTLLGSEAALD